MAMGITDHIWSIGELVDAANDQESPAPRLPPFTLIQGGRA
jgi:hypothetical protein